MFTRLRNWLRGESGLYEATRDATRETTYRAMRDGFPLGVEDFIDDLIGSDYREPTVIEAAENNGQTATAPRLTAAELKRTRKPDLLDLAAENGIDADDSWTAPQLRDALRDALTAE